MIPNATVRVAAVHANHLQTKDCELKQLAVHEISGNAGAVYRPLPSPAMINASSNYHVMRVRSKLHLTDPFSI